jgi:hypothetical protein
MLDERAHDWLVVTGDGPDWTAVPAGELSDEAPELRDV